MEEKELIISIISALAVVIVLILIVVFFFMGKRSMQQKRVTQLQKEDKKAITIEDMVEIAANRNSSKNDLTNAIMKVSKEFPFPQKVKGNAPKKAKIYLNFVLLITSHKKADAKLIAFMDYELKKVNKAYTTEIDIYENEGLAQRMNRT